MCYLVHRFRQCQTETPEVLGYLNRIMRLDEMMFAQRVAQARGMDAV